MRMLNEFAGAPANSNTDPPPTRSKQSYAQTHTQRTINVRSVSITNTRNRSYLSYG